MSELEQMSIQMQIKSITYFFIISNIDFNVGSNALWFWALWSFWTGHLYP